MSTHDRVKSLYVAFTSLALLLVATIGLSFAPLGGAHTWVGIGIAGLKSLIIAVVFMKLLTPSSSVRLASGASLLWLLFLILFVMSDYLTRGWGETQAGPLKNANHYTSYDRVEY